MNPSALHVRIHNRRRAPFGDLERFSVLWLGALSSWPVLLLFLSSVHKNSIFCPSFSNPEKSRARGGCDEPPRSPLILLFWSFVLGSFVLSVSCSSLGFFDGVIAMRSCRSVPTLLYKCGTCNSCGFEVKCRIRAWISMSFQAQTPNEIYLCLLAYSLLIWKHISCNR